MKRNGVYIMLALGLLVILSCNQDPIFHIISEETAPKKPRIEGAPTNMVIFTQNETPVMYVASGRLHWYAKANPDELPRWDLPQFATPQPRGKIISLAVTSNPDRLFALCMDGMSANATLRYMTHDGNNWSGWTDITNAEEESYPILQSMYADPDSKRLFAGARRGQEYSILYLADNDTLQLLQGNTLMLSGAVYHTEKNHHYLSTRGDGIYRATETETGLTATPLSYEDNERARKKTFMAMIKLHDEKSTIIAVERDGGTLYTVLDDSLAQMQYTGADNNGATIATGRYATGALALWEDYLDSSKKRFVAGIQGGLYSTTTTSYTHGYVEFGINTADNSNSFDTAFVRRDSGSLQTVDNTDQYSTSLGKRPINHLFQAPPELDPNRTFFASTQTGGLWSYRDRGSSSGGKQWNAEE